MQKTCENAGPLRGWMGATLMGLMLCMQLMPSSAAMPPPRPDADPKMVAAAKSLGEVMRSIDWDKPKEMAIRNAVRKAMEPHGWHFKHIKPVIPKDSPLPARFYSRIPDEECLNATSVAAGMGVPSRVEVLGLHEIWSEHKPRVVADMIRRNYESPEIASMVYSIAGQPRYELNFSGGRDCFYGFYIFLKTN